MIAAGCAWNPATRRVDFTLLSDGEEIRLGQQVDAELVSSVGLHDDEALATYVRTVGEALAAQTERSTLPWTFRVVESADVNAFALPGGFVYVTRGILAHLVSEAELAAVLAHEIGHVTGRHGVTQLSRARVAQRSVGVFRIFDPNLRHVGALAGGAAGLALLRHSRSDELEADRLALRYLGRAGYPPAAMWSVLDLLVLLAADAVAPPEWLSTHPAPNERQAAVTERLDRDPAATTGEVRQDALYARLEGLVIGEDPRLGAVVDGVFLRPNHGYRIGFPTGWKVVFDRSSVIAAAPEADLVAIVGDAGSPDVAAVEAQFLQHPRIRAGARWTGSIADFPARGGYFELAGEGGILRGLVVFVDRGGAALILLVAGNPVDFDRHSSTTDAIVGSLARMSDGARAAVTPDRLTIRRFAAPTSLVSLTDDPAILKLTAQLNRVRPEDRIEAGAPIKVIRRGGVGPVNPPPG
ncbi:MAG: M48 family metalloprotease [Nannocystaceae bacterium]